MAPRPALAAHGGRELPTRQPRAVARSGVALMPQPSPPPTAPAAAERGRRSEAARAPWRRCEAAVAREAAITQAITSLHAVNSPAAPNYQKNRRNGAPPPASSRTRRETAPT